MAETPTPSLWSEFLPELLNVVFHSLNDARDILSCAAVCSSWRDSSSDVYSRKFVPFLFVSHLSSDEESPIPAQFRVLSPAKLDFLGYDQTWVCGGTRGFLLTVDVSFPFDVHLKNLFTNTVTPLPPLISFEFVQWLHKSQEIFQHSEALIKTFVKKAVCSTSLSDPDWVVLIIYGTDSKLAFCRRGDKQWTDLDSRHVVSSLDDIVFCNGVFFAIDRIGEIYICELNPNNPNPKAIPLCSTSPFRHDRCRKYFAESDYNELWVVLKKQEFNDDGDFTTDFEIYEFNSETMEWKKVISLRGKALFLSPQGRCIAVFAGGTGSRRFISDNSVYFIDGNDEIVGLGPQNLSVFKWESKQISKIYQPRSWSSQMFWVTSTDVIIQR